MLSEIKKRVVFLMQATAWCCLFLFYYRFIIKAYNYYIKYIITTWGREQPTNRSLWLVGGRCGWQGPGTTHQRVIMVCCGWQGWRGKRTTHQRVTMTHWWSSWVTVCDQIVHAYKFYFYLYLFTSHTKLAAQDAASGFKNWGLSCEPCKAANTACDGFMLPSAQLSRLQASGRSHNNTSHDWKNSSEICSWWGIEMLVCPWIRTSKSHDQKCLVGLD